MTELDFMLFLECLVRKRLDLHQNGQVGEVSSANGWYLVVSSGIF